MKSNQKIQLALVTPFPPSKTTLNEYGYHLVKQFVAKNELEKVHVLAEKLDDGEQYEKIHEKVNVVPCWKFNGYANCLNILNQVRELKPTIVVLNLQFLLFGDKKVAAALGLFTPTLLRLFGFKCIVLLHNIMEEVDLNEAGITSNPVLKWIYTLIGNTLTRLILNANLVGVTIEKYVDTLRKKYKTKNVVLLPHGTFEIPPTPSYQLPPGPKQIMTFGKFGTYKKVEVLIDAIELIRNRSNLDMEIVIAGTDNPNVPGYLEGVQQKYSNVKNLRFTGYVEEEDVQVIFSESAMVVFPYTSTTGSSGVLHQTGSYGKAAILPNVGDLARLIEKEGYQGEFFEPSNPESLAQAIEKLLMDDEYRLKIEKQNYRSASALSLEDITDWYLIHFYQLTRSK